MRLPRMANYCERCGRLNREHDPAIESAVAWTFSIPHRWITIQDQLLLLVVAAFGLQPDEVLAGYTGLEVDDATAYLSLLSRPQEMRDGSTRPALLNQLLAKLEEPRPCDSGPT